MKMQAKRMRLILAVAPVIAAGAALSAAALTTTACSESRVSVNPPTTDDPPLPGRGSDGDKRPGQGRRPGR